MGWFNKKDNAADIEKMPELPELPDSPNTNTILPQISTPAPFLTSNQEESTSFSEIPPLPPKQRITKDLSESKQFISEPRPGMQKSRFSQDSQIFEPPEHTIENFGITKFREKEFLPKPEIEPIATKAIGSFRPSTKSFSKKEDSIYIRLDKFQLTMESFKEIKNKIREIEDLLTKTKEIKSREEKELEDWEREIESIKLKLDSIDKDMSEN